MEGGGPLRQNFSVGDGGRYEQTDASRISLVLRQTCHECLVVVYCGLWETNCVYRAGGRRDMGRQCPLLP